mmetsp:Transcript_4731/g.8584  ORF Transcript_4731/g.8584 Transcript_4731/m.8584 type:complete len:122 (+) Transcript_4731:87-452(+)
MTTTTFLALLAVFSFGTSDAAVFMGHKQHSQVALHKDECGPDEPFESGDKACDACHACRGSNKCPCAFFQDDADYKFCYDSTAPDMNATGSDAHNFAMHCDHLMPKDTGFTTCPGNAVHLH